MIYKQLLDKYSKIEQEIHPIINFLENNKNKIDFKDVYKGIITLQSPIVYKPDILFLGINPGDGAYNVLNNTKSEQVKTPLRMIGGDETFLKELNWYEFGNARGGWINDKWIGYKWYQRDKKINNSFPQRMIDLLYEIAQLQYKEEYKKNQYNNNKKPFWFDTLGKNIMYSNLYPIATTDVGDLYKILNSISKTDELKFLWKNQEKPNNWDVRLFFIRLIDKLINLVKPKLIVCMGKSTFDDFLYKKHQTNNKIYKSNKNNIPVIGFSRKGNWSGLLPNIAKEIVSL